MAQDVKTVSSVAIANVKTVDSVAIASVKTILGVDNTGGGPPSPDILWWKLNDGAGTDISADVGPDGTTNGTLDGTSLDLNGTSQQAQSNSAVTYGDDVITVMLWLAADTWNAGGNFQAFIESSANFASNSGTFALVEQFGVVDAVMAHSGGTRTGTFVAPSTAQHHIAMVFDNSAGDGTIKVYIDGSSVTVVPTGAVGGNGNFSAQTLNVGARNAASAWAGGVYEDIRAYAGEVSAADILSIFTAGPQ
jgi:hypothetical protein